jgi:competence protein ComEC
LRITFLDVGQGDATVIESPGGRVVVVDGGGHPGTALDQGTDPGNRVVVPFLKGHGLSQVDLIVTTHPDDDHVQGLVAVAERFAVRGILDGGYFATSTPYRALRKTAQQKAIPLYTARRGQKIDMGDGVRLEVLHPGQQPILATASPTNDNSIVLRVVYGKARVLLTGDAGFAAEEAMDRAGIDLSADILKLGHHGSRHSTGETFLNAVRPAIGIVSAGRNNTFGHPAREVLERLAAHQVRIFRTDRDGAIVAETDGGRWKVFPTRTSR